MTKRLSRNQPRNCFCIPPKTAHRKDVFIYMYINSDVKGLRFRLIGKTPMSWTQLWSRELVSLNPPPPALPSLLSWPPVSVWNIILKQSDYRLVIPHNSHMYMQRHAHICLVFPPPLHLFIWAKPVKKPKQPHSALWFSTYIKPAFLYYNIKKV